LKEENFPHLLDKKGKETMNITIPNGSSSTASSPPDEEKEEAKASSSTRSISAENDSTENNTAVETTTSLEENKEEADDENDIEQGTPITISPEPPLPTTDIKSSAPPSSSLPIMIMDVSENTFDEDNTYIEVPATGLPQQLLMTAPTATTPLRPPQKLRLAQNICTICLCNYEVGSDIVWLSNELCDHVFHEQCIEQWLMKQREGPLCPCCRRDFILDPYDLEEEEEEADSHLLLSSSSLVPMEESSTGEDDDNNNQSETVVVVRVPTTTTTVATTTTSLEEMAVATAPQLEAMEPSSSPSASYSSSVAQPQEPPETVVVRNMNDDETTTTTSTAATEVDVDVTVGTSLEVPPASTDRNEDGEEGVPQTATFTYTV
jgi:hypothetical protein